MIPEGTPSARRARRGRRRAKSRYMMRAAVTCKSGQSPTPLRFQIFKVCLDSSRRPRPRRWRRRRRRILEYRAISLSPSLPARAEEFQEAEKKQKGNFARSADAITRPMAKKEGKKGRKEGRAPGLETRSTIIVKSSGAGVRGSRGRFPERIGRAKGDAWQQPRIRGSAGRDR